MNNMQLRVANSLNPASITPSSRNPRGYNAQEILSSQQEAEKAGADIYLEFEKAVSTLVNSLNLLQTSSRQMGASIGLLSATDHFRRRLKALLVLSRTNAAFLFPHYVKKQSQLDKGQLTAQSKSRAGAVLEQFPESLRSLSKSINQLMDFLKDFPEFDDEALSGALIACAGDIDYRIDCLEAYKGQFQSTPVRTYVHEICKDLQLHFERVAVALKEFVEFRVPTMSSGRTKQGIINLTTFSIFFSGVTATTAGYITNDDTFLSAVTHVLFLSALVLSVAAAINSLLGMTWHLASFRSPVHRVPFWINLWLRRSPLVFTVLSVLLFYAALVTYVSSSSHHFLYYTILILTIICGIGIASISMWFEAERWVYNRYDGERWLLDVLKQWSSVIEHRMSIHWLKKLPERFSRPVAQWYHQQMENRSSLPSPGGNVATPSAPPGLLRNAARRVAILAENIPMTQIPSMTYGQATDLASADMDENVMEPATIRTATPSLKRLTITHAVEHKALISDLKFSPDGKLLASASWDRSATIWRAPSDSNLPMAPICTLPASGHIFQVSWSSDASLLLTRTIRTVNIWTISGENRATIGSRQNIQHVLWLSDTKEFLLVEKTQIDHYIPLNFVNGTIEYTLSVSHTFKDTEILDVAILPDNLHAIIVGNAITDHEELQPMLTRTEKRVMIYEFATQRVKRQAPLLQDVHNVKVSRNGKFALISYRHTVAPQCWKVEVRDHGQKSTLRVHCTYMCKEPVIFSAPARFGGLQTDDLVLAPTDSGSILIWDCESAMLLYTFPVDIGSGIPMCLAWNQMANDFMMASGTHHGTVQLWNISYSLTPMIPTMEIKGDVTPARIGPSNTATPDSKSRSLLLDRSV